MVDLSANLAQYKRHAFKPIKDVACVMFCVVNGFRQFMQRTSALKVDLYEKKGKC